MLRKLLITCATGLTLAVAAAHADPVVHATSTGNSVFGAVEGWIGAPLYSNLSTVAWFDIYYLGSDSQATNSFVFDGVTLMTVTGSNTGRSSLFGGTFEPVKLATVQVAPGLMDFSFTTDFGGSGAVANGSNPVDHAPSFFLSFPTCDANLTNCVFDTTIDNSTARGGSWALFGFNDGSDDAPPQYDDLVLMLQLGSAPVPEPATLLLLLLGATGVVASRRKT